MTRLASDPHWRYQLMGAATLLILVCPLPLSFPGDLLRTTVEWTLRQLTAPLPLLRLLAYISSSSSTLSHNHKCTAFLFLHL